MNIRLKLAYFIALKAEIKDSIVWGEYHKAVEEYVKYIEFNGYNGYEAFYNYLFNNITKQQIVYIIRGKNFYDKKFQQ